MSNRTKRIEDLHRRYGGIIYAHCLRILGERQDAEDAVQETFVNAFRSLSSFRYGDNYLPWLYRIASNTCLKTIRKRKRYTTQFKEGPDYKEISCLDDVDVKLHVRRALENLIDELDERNMEILMAHCITRMNQSEIAEFLGISRRAVVKRLTVIRKRAKELFGENDYE